MGNLASTYRHQGRWSEAEQLEVQVMDMTKKLLSAEHPSTLMLWHSFYFYFYFEHLNFTWSYLIDMKISWSLDHIDLILAILSRRSTILSWSLDLIIRWWFLVTLLLTCIQHAFDSCLSLTIDMHSTHVAAQHAFTICFTCVCLEDNTWTLVYKP